MNIKEKKINIPHTMWTNPLHFIACGFGIGAMPLFPGTWATLATILLIFITHRLPVWGYILFILIMIVLGIYLCGKTNRELGTSDHPSVVWDEIATFPIVFIAIPLSWPNLIIGFILFRFFDIYKPGPIGWIDQHIHSGFGVMLDDIIAASLSWIVLFLLDRIVTLFLH